MITPEFYTLPQNYPLFIMFVAQYCVTPTRRVNSRFGGGAGNRATEFFRDVKRRSLRMRRVKNYSQTPTKESCVLQGKTVDPK